jgi:hypothetical protein
MKSFYVEQGNFGYDVLCIYAQHFNDLRFILGFISACFEDEFGS